MNISDMGTIRARAAYVCGSSALCVRRHRAGAGRYHPHRPRLRYVRDAAPAINVPFTSLRNIERPGCRISPDLRLPAGLGTEVKLVGDLFLRAEWEYVRFTSQVDTSINTVRAGLGYKF